MEIYPYYSQNTSPLNERHPLGKNFHLSHFYVSENWTKLTNEKVSKKLCAVSLLT